MIFGFLNIFKLFKGRHYKRFIKKCEPIIKKINALADDFKNISDDELKNKTILFQERYKRQESLDSLLPEAFAVVKEAARRLCGKTIVVCDQHLQWDMVHFDAQIIGGIALHQKMVAEMGTGEGKTLVATLPLYLNALTGKNCQLVTVNDYLVRRDAQWMGALFKFLGLTVGYIQNGMDHAQRKEAYNCNITYGTASEFGFDYLRDNGMATRSVDQVQKDHYYCIIDEADSILIDEARTPLIISGEAEHAQEMPFEGFRSDVERLFDLQQRLCNRLALEAKELLEKESSDKKAAWTKLLQVKLGAPKNKQFLRLMENGSYRKLFEKFEMEMSSDLNKDARYEIKEELYFIIEEREQQADLTEKGRTTLRPNMPEAFVLPDLPLLFSQLDKQGLPLEKKNEEKLRLEFAFKKISEEIHCLSQLLKAYCLYEKDVHYVVQEGKVVIVDENTGRAMPGRRWSEGLHQAVECKERVSIEKETKTYASITIQNYFRLYEKIAGMTGTAETEIVEFFDIYKMSVMIIPPHKKCIRKDLNDVIFKTRREKYQAVLVAIQEAHATGQPVLVGTASVEASEVLAKMLQRAKIPHAVLNAKFHQQEAQIIAKAGQKGAVTIATNMAGRGTDIKLGEGVKELGGLLVLGTERHESRRIDRQLRGRCSRQGDPGASKFFISLEDDLMLRFAGPLGKLLEKSFTEGQPLEHPLLNKSIENAQKKVEQLNYGVRKRLLQYDDVLNKQRSILYILRNEALHIEEPKKLIFEMLEDVLKVRLKCSLKTQLKPEELSSFLHWVNVCFPLGLTEKDIAQKTREDIKEMVSQKVYLAYKEKEAVEGVEALQGLERFVLTNFIDRHWQDNLTEMEALRRSVGLRAYGQKDPLNEYKAEAFSFFEEMLERIREDVCKNIFRSATNSNNLQATLVRIMQKTKQIGPVDPEVKKETPREEEIKLPKITSLPKIAYKAGRNDPCPCKSGKKYKKCCGVE